jgi:hypothetical protein
VSAAIMLKDPAASTGDSVMVRACCMLVLCAPWHRLPEGFEPQPFTLDTDAPCVHCRSAW